MRLEMIEEEPELCWRLKTEVSAGASLRSRRAWGSGTGLGGARGGRRWRQSSESGLLLSSRCSIFGLTPARSSSVSLSPDRLPSSSLSR